MRNPTLFVTVAALSIALLLSCGKLKELPTAPGGVGVEPIDPTATFTRVQNEIFTPTCGAIGCHDRLGQQEQLILSPGQSYAMIVGKISVEMPPLSRVTPNDFANSYLYRKITGTGITGDRMPQGGPYLADAQTKLIRDWIRRGAPND
ncbi:MAG TPA: hypothetical protein VEZ11_11590 [Thermoanaerobaculia bacterium]|nr:hypothetical protein [Thermoanaerobaculia bacterium]